MENEMNYNSLIPEDINPYTLSDELMFEQQKSIPGQDILQPSQEAPADPAQAEEQPTFISETGAAVVGGAADAVESVGGFAELVGDTFKTGINKVFGRPVDEAQNPFSTAYQPNDAGWLDIPDEMVPENKTGLGKFARGLVEFGLLSAGTGLAGGAVRGGLGLGAKATSALKAAGVGEKGLRQIKFVEKGVRIAGEGAIADLVSSSSEAANLANLAVEYTPWMAPWVMDALAVDPDDNPWLARIKTVATGAGFNVVGHTITSFVKRSWEAHRNVQKGMPVDEANAKANQGFAEDLEEAAVKDAEYAKEQGKYRYEQLSLGIKNAEDAATRTTDSIVNPLEYDVTEKALLRPDDGGAEAYIKSVVSDVKKGGDGVSSQTLIPENYINKIARGDTNLRNFVEEQIDKISQDSFKGIGPFQKDELKKAMIAVADKLTNVFEEGGDITKNFKEALDDPANYRLYADNLKPGEPPIKTINPIQKGALTLVIPGLFRRVQDLSLSSVHIKDHVSVQRQNEMLLDSVQVAMTEVKKLNLMWGRDGKQMQLSADANLAAAQIKQVEESSKAFVDKLRALNNKGDFETLGMFAEANALAGVKIETHQQLFEFLNAKIFGGYIQGTEMRGKARQQMQSFLYNSLLSSLKTPVKAITGTNFIAVLRPFQAYYGAMFKMDKRQMAIAAAQIDAIGAGLAEGFQMFKYNWDLGLNRQKLTYEGRYDIEQDIAEWKSLKPLYDKYGKDHHRRAYEVMDAIITMNTSPWFKYSQNAMGAGDALARTLIGRMEQRKLAAIKALEEGVDPTNLKEFARKYDENFRNEIFTKNSDGMWVVSDKAATLAGDEAAMTNALPGNWDGFEKIGNIPLFKPFFPFVRTGYNALNLTFQHTPLVTWTKRYKDIMNGENLAEYGIRNQDDLLQARALVDGRLATGYSLAVLAGLAALTGKMTGNYPYDEEDKKAWQARNKQPESFNFGTDESPIWVSYSNIEPFNTIFSFIGNLAYNADILGEDLIEEGMTKASFMLSALLVDKSMLSGVSDLANIMNPTTSEELKAKAAARIVRSHFFFSGLSGQIGDIVDATQKEVDGFQQAYIRRDVGFKSFLPPKYDILSKDRTGKKLTYGAENPILRMINSVSPIAIVPADDDSVKQTILDMRFNLPRAISTGPEGEPLSAFERSEMQRYLSTGDLRKDLEQLFAEKSFQKEFEDYKRMNLTKGQGFDISKSRMHDDVRRVFKRAKDAAWSEFLRDNPDYRARSDERGYRKRLLQQGAMERIEQLYSPNGRSEFPR